MIQNKQSGWLRALKVCRQLQLLIIYCKRTTLKFLLKACKYSQFVLISVHAYFFAAIFAR